MELDNLIFDRTQADVDRVKTLTQKLIAGTATDTEKSEWLAGMKGAYNYADLNRVTAAMDYLNDYFLSLGYHTGYQPITVPHQSTSPLPDGYTQLEYIQSSGTQYIDTGVKPNQDTRVLAEVSGFPNTKYSQAVFGSRKSTTSSDSFTFLSAEDIQSYRSDYASNRATVGSSISYNDVFTIDKDGNVLVLNHEHVVTNPTATFTSVHNLFLFACNTNGSSSLITTGTSIYYCKIYDDSTLIRNYIPCKNPSNVVGLYDTVNGQFYANAGSGTFVSGEVAAPMPDPSKDAYLWYEDDFPTQTIMEQYIANVEALRSILPLPSGTPQTPDDMECLTYQEANAIEKILYTLESVLIAMEEAFLLRQANTLFMIAGGVFNG